MAKSIPGSKAGFITYIPQRDGIKLQNKSDVRKIFEEDKKAVSQADLIVANLDGMDVDAGTAWNLAWRTGWGSMWLAFTPTGGFISNGRR